MTSYNILNEATISGSTGPCWAALLAAFEGSDPWWAPYLVGRSLGPIHAGEVGAAHRAVLVEQVQTLETAFRELLTEAGSRR